MTINFNQRQKNSTKKLLASLMMKKQSIDTVNLFQKFLLYNSLFFKMGSYVAFQNSTVFDKIEHIELITMLNNLTAHIESSIAFQSQIENLYYQLFVIGNNGLIDFDTFKPLDNRIYSPKYINDIKYLLLSRNTLTGELMDIQKEIKQTIILLDKELKKH